MPTTAQISLLPTEIMGEARFREIAGLCELCGLCTREPQLSVCEICRLNRELLKPTSRDLSQAMRAPCPVCQSVKGMRCRIGDEILTVPHRARIYAARNASQL